MVRGKGGEIQVTAVTGPWCRKFRGMLVMAAGWQLAVTERRIRARIYACRKGCKIRAPLGAAAAQSIQRRFARSSQYQRHTCR